MLKKLITVLAVASLYGLSQAEEPEWVTSFDDALAKAQKENKKLLVDFYSPT
jgi:hypothetical protein